MNKFETLRKLNKGLKYVPIDNYIGTEIPIDISKNGAMIGEEIIEMVEGFLNLKVKAIEENNITGTIAKYGMIDITLKIENGMMLANSKQGIQILRDNGWVDEEPDEETRKEGLRFLEDMLNEIHEGKTYLKIYATSINQKEKWFKTKSYLLNQMLKGEKPKPRPEDKNQVFRIDDMCFTNYSGIWLWKYFYM